jgi:RNA polymerase sigma-70 factor (ECF subfamily)
MAEEAGAELKLVNPCETEPGRDRIQGSDEVAPAESWVDAWQAGKDLEGNFRRLFDRYAPVLFAFFRKRGFPAEQCEDLVQESFLGVYQGLAKFRREVPFENWLFELATNAFRKAMRRQSAKKRSAREEAFTDWSTPPQNVHSTSETPDSAEAGERLWALRIPPAALCSLLGKERLRTVLEGLDQLPAQMRRCAILAWCDEYRNHEIATLLRISPQTVKVHQFKARKRLRALLAAVVENG